MGDDRVAHLRLDLRVNGVDPALGLAPVGEGRFSCANKVDHALVGGQVDLVLLIAVGVEAVEERTVALVVDFGLDPSGDVPPEIWRPAP